MISLKYPWLVLALGCALVTTARAQSFVSVSVTEVPIVVSPVLKPPPPPPKLKAVAKITAVPPRLEASAGHSVIVVDPAVLPVAPALLQALYTEARVELARTDTMARAMNTLNDIARAGYSAAGQLLALLGAVVPSAKADGPVPFSPSIDYGTQTNANPDPNLVYSIATSIQDPAFSTAQLVETFELAPDENF